MTEKIFAAHAGVERVSPNEFVFAKLDLVMGTDVTVPLAIEEFRKTDAAHVFDTGKIALVNDHFVPAKDIKAAQLSKAMRLFAEEMSIENYFEVGRSGLCHCIVPESGLVIPGDLVIGADSHTCTYGGFGAFATGVGSTDMAVAWALGETWFRVPASIRVVLTGTIPPMIMGKDIILHILGQIGVEGALYASMEFCGPVIDELSLSDRLTITNMAIEAGAKGGIIEADHKVLEFIAGRTTRTPVMHRSDPDARYDAELVFDVSTLEPQIAAPYLPSNAHPAKEYTEVKVDQVVLGSCTNGRLEDFRAAAELLRGRSIAPALRMIVIPGTQKMYLEMVHEGLVDAFVGAGAVMSTPTCGPCIGGHMGILADDEIGLYTTNRNFYGRNGALTSKVYLGSPLVAAATALTGHITDPRSVA